MDITLKPYCHILLFLFPVFANAIVALSKLGDELFLQPLKDGIRLIAFNGMQSTYGVFIFVNNFFSSLDTEFVPVADVSYCRLSMKTALSLFKSAHFMERNLISCTLTVHCFGHELLIEFQHTYDISRFFDVNLMEDHEPPASEVDRNEMENSVTISASPLVVVVENDSGYSAEFIIATVESDDLSDNVSPLPTQRCPPQFSHEEQSHAFQTEQSPMNTDADDFRCENVSQQSVLPETQPIHHYNEELMEIDEFRMENLDEQNRSGSCSHTFTDECLPIEENPMTNVKSNSERNETAENIPVQIKAGPNRNVNIEENIAVSTPLSWNWQKKTKAESSFRGGQCYCRSNSI
ncbi:Rad9 [Dictyocaulus viviparus]|uniref:Rad9 n=1 Tax=Dictyocaulus viviparus TaxID=29172 RepID=A0A0D8Y151_DICVI|nr:Rad9 [Dictyocaulus viviparus]